MPFKTDASGNIVSQDLNGQKLPVFVHADGKEAPFDADSTIGTISRLNGEAKANRERAERAEQQVKAFEGITDPAAAIKALNTIKNLDDKKLIDAGEVEKVKAETIRALEDKYAPVVKEVDTLKGALYNEKIGGAFARSKFIAEKVAIPADLLQASFGARFKIEDGNVVAYGADGNKLYSKTSPGNPAGFEEALEILVDQYPHKASILKGSGAAGGGAGGSGNGANVGGKRSMSREQFNSLDLAGQRTAATEASKGLVVITD
jgi:hypothetical protein